MASLFHVNQQAYLFIFATVCDNSHFSRTEDEVVVMRGHYKGNTGRVIRVHRAKWVVHIDKITREKANGTTVHVGVHPSKVCC